MSNGNVVGIDVSKAHLDVGMATGRTRPFRQRRRGHCVVAGVAERPGGCPGGV